MTLKKRAEETEEYIRGLRHLVHPSNSKSKYTDRQHVTSGLRKCGFVGFIVCLRNIFVLYEDLKEKYGFEYLLTYKLLQDMLESFFSAIRMRGGFTNNPTCYQFQYAMRRLISRQQIVVSETGNCLSDDIPILTVSSSRDQLTNPTDDPEDGDLLENELFEIDPEVPSELVQEVVKYISGYIVRKFKEGCSRKTCPSCFESIVGEPGSSTLIDVKNRGYLSYPSDEMFELCLYSRCPWLTAAPSTAARELPEVVQAVVFSMEIADNCYDYVYFYRFAVT